MAYVSSFVYCESIGVQADLNGNARSIINNPLPSLNPIAIPGNYSFSVSMVISDITVPIPSTVGLNFIDPTGIILNSVSLEIPKSIDANLNNVRMDMDYRNLVLPIEGKYVTEVVYDGKSIGNFSIPVIKSEVVK